MATAQRLSQCRIAAAFILVGVFFFPGVAGKRMQLVSSSSTRVDIAKRDSTVQEQSIISEVRFKQQLRTCNAYTDSTPVSIIHHVRKGERQEVELTPRDKPLGYKQCMDFSVQLGRGDSLEFKQNSMHRGTFLISSLPQRDTILLLVLHRKPDSSLLGFSSHVFRSVPHAQIAVLDMYSGSSKGSLAIQDTQQDEKSERRSEPLAFNEVVALNAGRYDCVLKDGKKQSKVPLIAASDESYVALRVGSEGLPGFPEEVVVFPALSGSWRCSIPGVLAIGLVLLLRP